MKRSFRLAISASLSLVVSTWASGALADEPPEPAPPDLAAPEPIPPPAEARDAPPAAAPIVTTKQPTPPRNALSVQLASFLNNGVTVQYERQVASRFSLATSLGHRWSGGDSFDVSETGVGLEGRFWILGRAPFQRWGAGAMVGPFIGVRADFGLTRVTDDDRFVGSSMRIGESISGGGRIAFGGRFELTPSAGIGLRHEFDPRGRLAPWTRFEPIRFGMTFGVMF